VRIRILTNVSTCGLDTLKVICEIHRQPASSSVGANVRDIKDDLTVEKKSRTVDAAHANDTIIIVVVRAVRQKNEQRGEEDAISYVAS